MASRSVQTLGSQPAGSRQARALLRASPGDGRQQDVLTWNGGQRLRRGLSRWRGLKLEKGGLLKSPSKSTSQILSPETVREGVRTS